MANYIVSSGITSDGIVLLNDFMTVDNGGKANNTTVDFSGYMYVALGGVANDTIITYLGYVYVLSGGNVNNVNVSNGGYLSIDSGGTATDVSVSSGGSWSFALAPATYIAGTSDSSAFKIENGRVADLTVNSGCTLNLSSGGTATDTAVNSCGKMYISSGGTASNTTVNSYGSMVVSSGGTASNTTVNSYGEMYISSGGTASNTTVNSYGEMYISSGGTTDNTTVNRFGKVYISSGGTASNTMVNSRGEMYISSGGTVGNATVNSYGEMYISSGGTGGRIIVSSGGSFYLFSGGTATDITISSKAFLCFDIASDTYITGTSTGSSFAIDNGIVSNYAINLNGTVNVLSGGKADHVLINSFGTLNIFSGGVANNVTIEVYGDLVIYSGGIANNTTVAKSDGSSSNGSFSYGKLYISSGGLANDTIVNDDGILFVSSAGVAKNTTVTSYGEVDISSGGMAEGVMLKSGGMLSVLSGATATDIAWIPCEGKVCIENGASATFVSQYSGVYYGSDDHLVSHTASMSGKKLNEYYTMYVMSDGNANNTTVDLLGEMYISSGGTVTNTTLEDGEMHVFLGGVAINTKVTSGAYLYVSSGGTATDIVWTPCEGKIYIENGADISFVNQFSGVYYTLGYETTSKTKLDNISLNGIDQEIHVMVDGVVDGASVGGNNEIFIHSGGTAIDTENRLWGYMYVYGGSVNNTDNSGQMYVYSGGTATKTLNSALGQVYIYSGGTAIDMENISNGQVFVCSGGMLDNTTAENSYIYISSGGAADRTTIKSGGTLFVSSGGTATNIHWTPFEGMVYIENGASATFVSQYSGVYYGTYNRLLSHANVMSGNELGYLDAMLVMSGGIARDITVSNGGQLYVSSGGKLTGSMSFMYDPEVIVANGAILDFDISNSKPEDSALVNDFSFVSGFSKYTITVTSSIKNGTYVLAENVVEFSATITVVNSSGAELGFLSVGDTTKINKANYVLTLENDILSLTVSGISPVDKTTPVVSSVKANIISPTNKSITVTADFTDNVAVASSLYKIGDKGEWKDYSGGVTVTENTTIYFKAVDTSGNESKSVSYKVTNIDKIKPTVTKVKAGSTAPTSKPVTVTAVFSDDVKLASSFYKIDDNGAWTAYDGGVVVTKNATVFFKAVDAAGNESEIASFSVTNIEDPASDTTVPAVTNIRANITAPTKQNVTVTADFTDDVAVASSLYKIGVDGGWKDYKGSVIVTENTTVYFKAIDSSGNESTEEIIKITNIDRVAPDKPTASADITVPTNQVVTVKASFSNDSFVREYSMDGSSWSAYPGAVKFLSNGTVWFRAADEAGNVSPSVSYKVSNIDKTAPAKPTAKADITTATTGTVTVTAKFSNDSAKKEYSIDGSVWKDYTAAIVFSSNGTAYFRGTDAAGNVSEVVSYAVTNIQVVQPDNKPDNGSNDWLYNRKTKTWNEENIPGFYVNDVTAGDSMIYLDRKGTVRKSDMYNFLGRATTEEGAVEEDSADYAKIELAKGAALKLSVDSTVAGTFYIYQATKDKKGNLTATQRQKISVKANKRSPVKLATIYLEVGEYFVGMETKLHAAKKGDTAGYYNVNLTDTRFFLNADDGWNNHVFQRDDRGKEINTELNTELEDSTLVFGHGVSAIRLDTGTTGKDSYDNWVGFSDTTDYRGLSLENAVNLTLSLTATGKAKLTIWKISSNPKSGAISLTSKGSVMVKPDKTGTIKSKFLDAGDYLVSVTSTDAAKGGDAYYNVSVGEGTVFFDSADNGTNNVLFNKRGKTIYGEDEKHHFISTKIELGSKKVRLDGNAMGNTDYENFVGYQDAADYAKIELASDGNLSFDLKATGDATFTIYEKSQDKKGNDTLKAIQTTKLTLAKGKTTVEATTDLIADLAAGEYYVSMTAKSTKANASGSVFYNVTATLEPSLGDALSMPETDSLGISDALGFGGYDADVLADVSASALAELDDKSAWQNIASLA